MRTSQTQRTLSVWWHQTHSSRRHSVPPTTWTRRAEGLDSEGPKAMFQGHCHRGGPVSRTRARKPRNPREEWGTTASRQRPTESPAFARRTTGRLLAVGVQR